MGRAAGSRNRHQPQHGTMDGWRAHRRRDEPQCLLCRAAKREYSSMQKQEAKANRDGPGFGKRAIAVDLWPGITQLLDARCSCTRAPMGGVYQVKVRDASCVNHGGSLESVLSRMARLAVR